MNEGRSRTGGLVLLLFALSGVSALIYEIIWVRLLTMYVGGSAFAVSIVLTVFMAGLAAGSAAAARLVDRLREPDSLGLAYGVLELAVGLYGLVFPSITLALKPLYAMIYRGLCGSPLAYNAVSGVVSTAVLLFPTILMGATLPLLCRYYVTSLSGLGTRTGRLYGSNTIGAALGSLICGFFLIRWLGVHGTLACAVGINIVIGLLCIGLFGFPHVWRSLPAALQRGPERADGAGADGGDRQLLLLLAVSGFCSMGYEVIWTKLLALLVGPTTYSFTLVLFTFIMGLALGSILFGRLIDKARRPMLLLFGSQVAAALTVLAASQLFGSSQIFFSKLLYAYRSRFALGESAKALCLFAVMLPATVCLGAVFPICVKLAARSVDSLGRVVGRLYMWNTVGALLGSCAAGFALVPLLGQAHSLSALALAQVGIVTITCRPSGGSEARRGLRITVLAVGLLAAACALALPRWAPASLARARYQRFGEIQEVLERLSFPDALRHGEEEVAKDSPPTDYVYLGDGIGGFVAVGRTVQSIGTTNLFLTISGKTDASTQGDQSTQVLLAHVPMLFHTNAQSVMVLGLASGVTAGEILHYPVKQVDVLEISPQVVHACEFFAPWNNGVLADPRCRIVVQDARTHLILTDRRYDVITSEPSNPWMAGVANLFTEDFFAIVRQRLNTGGIFVQWIHSYQMDWDSFAAIGRSISRVFPGSLLLKTATSGSDYLFVCFKDRQARFEMAVAERNEKYAALSANMRLPSPRALYPLIVAENMDEVFGDGPRHTDEHPVVEYLAPRLVAGGGVDFSEKILSSRRVSPFTQSVLDGIPDLQMRLMLAEFMESMGVEPFGLLDRATLNSEEASRYQALLARFCGKTPVADFSALRDPEELKICLDAREKAIERHLIEIGEQDDRPALAWIYGDLGNVSVARGAFEQAAERYRRSLRYQPDCFRFRLRLGVCYQQAQAYADAASVFAALHASYPASSAVLTRLGAVQLRMQRRTEALEAFAKAVKLDSRNAPALAALGAILGEDGDYQKAIAYSGRAIKANPGTVKAYQNMAVALARLHRGPEALNYVEQGLRVAPHDPTLGAMRETLLRETSLPTTSTAGSGGSAQQRTGDFIRPR